jgi:DNA-packaging protein gp3
MKYETPEMLQEACDEYIAANPGKMTITGLAMWLGFCDRQSLYDYQKKEEFSCIIKAARLAVENDYELALRSAACTGAIFALKNMGWRDKVETGFTNGDGEDINPVALFQIPDNGRRSGYETKDNPTAGGLSDKGA